MVAAHVLPKACEYDAVDYISFSAGKVGRMKLPLHSAHPAMARQQEALIDSAESSEGQSASSCIMADSAWQLHTTQEDCSYSDGDGR